MQNKFKIIYAVVNDTYPTVVFALIIHYGD